MFCRWSHDILWTFLQSAQVLQEALSEFSKRYGLSSNHLKSFFYKAGSDQGYEDSIRNIFQFQKGDLPVKYLGIPLITTRLTAPDCQPLIDSMMNRIKSWTVKPLSYAGRLQLIKSVFSSMHIYWSSVLMLPKTVISRIEQIMRDFLWKGKDQ